MEKPTIAKHVFQVMGKEYITPSYIRVKLQGEGTRDFAHCTIGANNKIFIPPHGKKDIRLAASDVAGAASEILVQPIIRTYTHRGIAIDKNEIVIDFVDHGDNGPASSWARSAGVGDQLGVAMKVRKAELVPVVDWYCLVGDATAIPVICCILESLPPTAKGHCIIEVASSEDVHPEVKHEGFTIEWLYNSNPENGSGLSQEVEKVVIPEKQSHFAYVACEYSSVKEIRHYFRNVLQWKAQELYAFSYWKAGVAEDRSADDRRREKQP